MTRTLHQRQGPSRQATDNDSDQNQTQDNRSEIIQDDPLTVRGVNDLLKASADALQSVECTFATIRPQGQPFYLNCLHRAWDEVSGLFLLCQRKSDSPDSWFERTMTDHCNRVTFLPSSPPPGLSVGRLVLSPRIINLWAVLRAHEQDDLTYNPGLTHYTVFQGSTGGSKQRFMISWTVTSALASAFFALANGYELVFAASVLASEAKFLDSAELRSCNDCNELLAVKAIQDVAHGQSPHKRRIGIIF